VIESANRIAAAGNLDFVVVTGDIIDYGYDTRWFEPCRPEDSNFKRFADIITGSDKKGEL